MQKSIDLFSPCDSFHPEALYQKDIQKMKQEIFSQWGESTQETNDEHFDNVIKTPVIDTQLDDANQEETDLFSPSNPLDFEALYQRGIQKKGRRRNFLTVGLKHPTEE